MPQSNQRKTIPDLAVMCGLFALALLVCLYQIGHKDLWLDEALSLNVTNSWGEMPERFDEVRGASWLYYVLLAAWRSMFESDAGLRALSALFAAVAVVLTYSVGVRLASRQVGLFASLLLLFNFAFVQHAQEVRMYTLTIMLVCANALTLLVAMERKSYWPWLLSGLIAGLCYGVHYFSIFAWGAQFFGALILWHRRSGWRGPAYAVAVALVCFILQVLPFNPVEGTPRLAFVPVPGLKELSAFLAEIGGEGWKRAALFYAAAGVAIVFAIAKVRQTTDHALGGVRVLSWLAMWFIAPIAALIVLSHLITPVFVHRYMMTVLPALALLIGYSLSMVRPRALGLVLFVGMLVSQGRALQLWYAGEPIEQWRAAAAHYKDNANPSEPVVLFQFYVEAPFRRYAELHTRDGLGVPALLEDTEVVYLWRQGEGELVRFEELAHVLIDAPSFWLILSHDTADRIRGEEIRTRLFDVLGGFAVADEKQVKGVRVVHMKARSSQAGLE